MKTRLALTLASALAVTAPAALAGAPAPTLPAPAALTCAPTPLMQALATLRDDAALRVSKAPGRVVVEDRAHGRVLLEATCDGLAQAGPIDARRATERQPVTEVTRDVDGRVVYSHSATPLGARVTVIAPSRLNRAGLDVTAFDNDDVYVADAAGRLLYQRQTRPDGTLVEREAATVGCGCERVTSPEGRVTVERLP